MIAIARSEENEVQIDTMASRFATSEKALAAALDTAEVASKARARASPAIPTVSPSP